MQQEIMELAEFPDAFGMRFTVTEADLDGFSHVNNAVYLRWLDTVVWEHTRAVGLCESTCRQLNRGMAVARHEIDYIASAYAGDEVAVFNWICSNDGKLRAARIFQIVRLIDQKTILRAKTHYICTNLTNGRPARMPQAFIESYAVTAQSD